MDMTAELGQAIGLQLPEETQMLHTYCRIREIAGEEGDCPPLQTCRDFEIDVITEGSGFHAIGQSMIPCKESDIYFLCPGVTHRYFCADTREQMTVRRLIFRLGDWLKGDMALPGSKNFCCGVFQEDTDVACARLNSQLREKINGILDAIECELADQDERWRGMVGAELIRLFTLTSRYIHCSVKHMPGKPKDWEMVCTVLRMVEGEYCNSELSLEILARRLFVSPSHLSRTFKAYTGQLFSEHLRGVRLQHAARLLEESRQTVEKIVFGCGFRDISAFYRNFREAYGMSPQIYRQTIQKPAKSSTTKQESEDTKLMEILSQISENLQKGKAKIVKELVQQALDLGAAPADILNQGLLHGMDIIGEKFKNNEVFVPEVLVAARAMNMGAQVLKPHLAESGIVSAGKVCLGTVKGDLHDIGKNLVRMMMEGKGLEVIDLGTDVPAETFVQTAIEQNCQVICCSALLTTTMNVMEEVVQAVEAAGIRDKVKIMVGGAPVTDEFCAKIGADRYTPDAATAAEVAVAFCKQ